MNFYHPDIEYEKLIEEKLGDKQLRDNLRHAMDALRKGRKTLVDTRYNNWEELRERAKEVKLRSLANLGPLILEFEKNCEANGIKMHFASSADEANRIILSIAKEYEVDTILKGKSMASEEIHLNDFLQANGIEASETDLGEIIIQFVHEEPVHIVVPAIHKNRYQVGEIFHKYIKDAPLESEPKKLNAIARKYLRGKFRGFKMGLTGVNFAIADKGAIWLIENEGNGRMSSTACDVHVAICGIEKVVESFEDASILNTMLAPSAVGAPITAYNNIITGPRKKGEKDGPTHMHIVMLDNNRSRMLANKEYYKALSCIRCGTCLNHCPVYDKIGGHSYMATYPGPIGEVISPQIFGLNNVGYITNLCSLCGRCAAVCPVKIPLDSLIRKLRSERAGQGSGSIYGKDLVSPHHMEAFLMGGFGFAGRSGNLWRISMKVVPYFLPVARALAPYIPILKNWVSCRSFPVLNGGLDAKVKALKGVRYE